MSIVGLLEIGTGRGRNSECSLRTWGCGTKGVLGGARCEGLRWGRAATNGFSRLGGVGGGVAAAHGVVEAAEAAENGRLA